MSLSYVRGDVLLLAHERLIRSYGGVQGVRDPNGLESALARPRNLHGYTGEVRVGALAASLAWSLLRNHPFIDGNKRSALVAFALMVKLNNHRLACSRVEETAMTLKAAASMISEDEWTAWALRVVVPHIR